MAANFEPPAQRWRGGRTCTGNLASTLDAMPQHNYRPDVDGLRAVAVLGVVLFHAGFGLDGGYVGVDVFFVISGFLITRLIRQELAAGDFSLAGFWERRIRRILPALVLVVGCTVAAGTFLLVPTDLVDLAESSVAQALLVSNVYFWLTAGYFDGPTELKPLMHTWSLAVEEQFYLGFPLLVVACRRLATRHWTALLGGLGMLSFALSVWGTYAFPSATFYLLPTRAWELLAGAMLAGMPPNLKLARTLAEPLGYLGMAGILYAFVCYSSETRFPGAAAIVPCAATAMIIASNAGQRTSLGRLLAMRPVVFIGLISYSLYLWHWPILAFMRYRIGEQLPLEASLAAVLLSVVLAVISWRFVEAPFRRRAPAATRARAFKGAIAVSVSILTFSAMILGMRGFPSRFPEESLRFVKDIEVPRRFQTPKVDEIVAGNLPRLGSLADEDASFLLWGDSHAMAVGELLEHLAIEHDVQGAAACRSGTAPLVGTWRAAEGPSAANWNQAVLDYVVRHRIRHVILVSRWEINIEGRADGSLDSLIVDDQSRTVSAAESKQVLRRGLRRTVAALERAGANVWIMRQIPLQVSTPEQLISEAARNERPIPLTGVDFQQHAARQANANQVLSEFASAAVRVLDPDVFCFDRAGRSRTGGEGRSYYADDDHLSRHGAEQLLRTLFEPVFAEIGQHSIASRPQQTGAGKHRGPSLR
jgi:peptidoglycan/LPS O-acetylase OafA/YrhL